MTHVVVVGAGTAGCVVASRLTERTDHTVTLIEAGRDAVDRADDSASYLDAMAAPGRTWPSTYPQGRGVGGSSAVNGMLVDVPDPFTLSRLGLTGADVPTLLPAEPAADAELGPLDRALLASAPDAVRVPLSRVDGVRRSVAEIYLAPARSRANLVLRSETTVARLVIRRRRCVGVETGDGDLIAADAVIVAAGAIHTPVLLRRSDPAATGVGEGVLDHPSIALTVELHADAVPDPHSLVTATSLRRGGVEMLPMNHLGPGAPGLGVVMAALLRPEGAGHVVVPDDPAVEPGVEFEWSSTDQVRLAAAAGELRRLLERPSFANVLVSVADDVTPGSYVHACGSCRCALGPGGAVDDVDGLYVCDASALPALPAGGTMLVTIVWAERFARRFA